MMEKPGGMSTACLQSAFNLYLPLDLDDLTLYVEVVKFVRDSLL